MKKFKHFDVGEAIVKLPPHTILIFDYKKMVTVKTKVKYMQYNSGVLLSLKDFFFFEWG